MRPKTLSAPHSHCRSVGRSASRRQTHPVLGRLLCRHTLANGLGAYIHSQNTFGKRASPSPLITLTFAVASAAPPAVCQSGCGCPSTSMFLDEEWLLLRLVKFWESYCSKCSWIEIIKKTPVPIRSHCLAPAGGAGRGSGELANHAVLPSITCQLLPYTGEVTRDERPQ